MKDRVDMTQYSDEKSTLQLSTFNAESLLPTEDDLKAIRDNFAVILSRVLVKYIPSLQQLQHAAEKHITHQHYKEVSQRSEVVSYNWCS